MSRQKVLALLGQRDRSALVLSKYVPARGLDGWLALRAVNIETAKISDTAEDPKLALQRLEFWVDSVKHAVDSPSPDFERLPPALALLSKAVLIDKAAIHKRYLITLVQSRQRQVLRPPINSIEDLGHLGEGTASQILYATFDMLSNWEAGTAAFLQEHAELDAQASEVLAHIGQAMGIAQSLRALEFYVRRQNRVMLPSDVLAQHGLNHQTVIDVVSGNGDRGVLKDAVFDVATAANDHILTARHKMEKFRDAVGKTPPSLNTTSMAAVPIALYLERLQKNDFDVGRPVAEWKLPWRSWRARSGHF